MKVEWTQSAISDLAAIYEQIDEADSVPERTCHHCRSELEPVRFEDRPSWRDIFEKGISASNEHWPQVQINGGRPPPDETSRS